MIYLLPAMITVIRHRSLCAIFSLPIFDQQMIRLNEETRGEVSANEKGHSKPMIIRLLEKTRGEVTANEKGHIAVVPRPQTI